LPCMSIVSSLVFCLTGPGTRLLLRSFPTRRSSDLAHALVRVMSVGSGDDRLPRPHLARDPQRLEVGNRARRRQVAEVRVEAEHRDRKSTRLNSSHLGISYAVFCLKKKKNKRKNKRK